MNQRRGNVPIGAHEGEKAVRITVIVPAKLLRAGLSDLFKALTDDVIKLLVQQRTPGQKRRVKVRRKRKPRGRKTKG